MGKYLRDYQLPNYSEEDKPRIPKRPKKFKEDEFKPLPKKKFKK